jgi:hypothetical protein
LVNLACSNLFFSSGKNQSKPVRSQAINEIPLSWCKFVTTLTLISIISKSWLVKQLKKAMFWFSAVLGAAISFVFYQEISGKLWPAESLRVKLITIFLFVCFSAACFCLLNFFLIPCLKKFTRYQRAGILVSSALIPLILVIACVHADIVITRFQIFSKTTVHFLLPLHTITIEISPTNLAGNEEIMLTNLSTQALGDISLDALNVKGWERRGDQLFLTDPADNQITWRGIVGYDATVVLKSRSDPAIISIAWDKNKESYNLLPAAAKEISFKEDFQVPFYAGWIPLAIALVLSIGFLSFILLIGLLLFPGLFAPSSPNRWAWAIYATPMYLTWSFYLLVFWPGFLSFDSINQWTQMVTGNYVNWHPVAHTLTIWLITHLWNTPAAMALLQILVLGGVLGWGIATLREFGLPNWTGWMVAVVMAILPSNGLLSITLWKDILFSAIVIALTILVLKIVVSRGAWLSRKTSWISLGIVLTFISLYRQNGFFVAFACLLILTWVFRKYWKSFAKAAGLLLVIYFVFSGPVLQLLNAQSINKARYQVVIANLLAGQMNAGTYFSPQDAAVLKPAFYKDTWPYDCYRNHDLITGTNLDRDYLMAHTRDLINIALKVTFENPAVTIEHFACQGDFVFYIPQSDAANEPVYLDVYSNKFGLKQASIFPGLYASLYCFFEKLASNHELMWILWREPFWMYLGLFGCILFMIRNKSWQPVLVLVPGLLTVLPYIIVSLGQIFRYVYCMYLIGILLSSYFWLCKLPEKPTEQ